MEAVKDKVEHFRQQPDVSGNSHTPRLEDA